MKKITLSILLLFPVLCISQIPDWQWAKNYSLALNSGKQYTAADNQGNVYLVGDFSTPTMAVAGYAFTNFEPGTADIYIIKYDRDGNVMWARKEGGTWHNHGKSIGTDNEGNLYLLGSYHESITIGSTTLTNTNGGNFYAKFDSSGNPIWAKSFNEPTGSWKPNDIKTDASGNVYIAGHYTMPSLTLDGVTLVNENYSEATSGPAAFFGKFDPNGNCLWLKGPQSTAQNLTGNFANSIAVDANGNVYVAGRFNNSTLNFGSVTLTKTAAYDYTANMFVVKYDAGGTALWGKNAGSAFSNLTIAEAVTLDANSNVFVSGFFSNTISFDAISITAGGGSKPYTVKFDTNGNALWAKNITGSDCAGNVYGIDTDSQGNVYLAGMTNCASLNFGNGVALGMGGIGGVYVVKYNASGQAVWAKKSSSENINNVTSIDCHNENEIYVAGTFTSPTISFGTQTLTKTESNFDLYIAKLNFTPLSSEEFETDAAAIYPNPASHFLRIQNLDAVSSYELFDAAGRNVARGVITPGNAQISVEQLPSGVYYIKIGQQHTSVTRKVIKM